MSREPKPCETCDGTGCTKWPGDVYDQCEACGGSGVVDTVQVHALEQVTFDFDVFAGEINYSNDPLDIADSDESQLAFRLVALPEETQQ